MAHIKKINEMNNDMFNRRILDMKIPIHFTKDDNRNIENIAMLLEALSAKWSDFVEMHEEMMDSDTDAYVKQLSLVAKKLMGEWDDSICF